MIAINKTPQEMKRIISSYLQVDEYDEAWDDLSNKHIFKLYESYHMILHDTVKKIEGSKII